MIGDTSVEPDETFLLRLSNAKHAVIADAAGQGTIRNDDAPPPPPTRTLTVTKAGSGAGRVTSLPGIDCGSDCSEGYPDATSVALTASADSGSTFAGWTGACSGTGTCTVTMNADASAIATFNATPSPTVTTPNVFLGYADTYFAPSGLLIPSPWQGDPGVVFLGCSRLAAECGEYNAGAIRIDNPASNPALTLIDAYVDIETCRFQPWGQLMPAIAAPGESFVLTQSGVLGPPQPAPCDASMPVEWRPLTNFATVTGPFDTASPPSYNCDTSDSIVSPPTVTLVFAGGMQLRIVDDPNPAVQNDEILNTGGTHIFACTGQSPGQPWTAVPTANITRTP